MSIKINLFLLFVYGTLKRGGANHERFLKRLGAEFLGQIHSAPGYQMHSRGWFPVVSEAEQSEGTVFGELYGVSQGLLDLLDHYEGVNHEFPEKGLFARKRIKLQNDQREPFYYHYNGPVGGLEPIPDGSFSVRKK